MDEQPQSEDRTAQHPEEAGEAGPRLLALERRVEAIEEELHVGGGQIRARQLTIVDGSGRARLVAEVVDDVMELRIDVPPVTPGRRTAVLVFGTGRAHDDVPAGAGLQIWADGDLVQDISWWSTDR